jgi:hypothetical protein
MGGESEKLVGRFIADSGACEGRVSAQHLLATPEGLGPLRFGRSVLRLLAKSRAGFPIARRSLSDHT